MSDVAQMIPHKIKITPKEEFGLYDIEMDDIKLENVSVVHIDMGVDKIPKVQIELMAGSAEIEIPEAEVKKRLKKKDPDGKQ